MRCILQKIRTLSSDLYILYLAFKHPKTPYMAKLFVGFIAVYTLSPIDLISDFIPVLGYVDEAILIPIFLTIAYRLVPYPILEECRKLAQINPMNKKLRLWTGAIIILIIGLLFTLYVVHWYFRQG